MLCPKVDIKSMVNCTMSKLKHPKKCYVQDTGFFSVPEVQDYLALYFQVVYSKHMNIGLDILQYFKGLHFLDPQQWLGESY